LKPTQTHITEWLRLHARTVGLVACAVAMPLLLPPAPYEGHFLYKAVQYAKSPAVIQRTLTRPSLTASSALSRSSRRYRGFAPSAPKRQAGLASSRGFTRSTTIAGTPAFLETLRAAAGDFPAFGWTVHPVARVPDWGRMRSAAIWDLPYDKMPESYYVSVPEYDLDTLTIPLSTLTDPITAADIPVITAKLYYSTRHYGKYDIDAGEHSGFHPGVDLKLSEGTPIGAVAGGRVHVVGETDTLGRHVIIEHRHPTEGVFFSVYGHLDDISVAEGQDVVPGELIGAVGMTGNTSGPHLHLQIDRARGGVRHVPYVPTTVEVDGGGSEWTVNPMEFLGRYSLN
jgi:murein DD-endopeptidase MepM/ murein hydrolase activator NlpD